MLFMVESGYIFGPTGDMFFTKSHDRIRAVVKNLNHATRFYFTCKFLRRNVLDFEDDSEIRCNFSYSEICVLLGVGRCSILKFLSVMKG